MKSGLYGALAGGFAWTLLLGIAIGSPLLIIGALVLGIGGGLVFRRIGPAIIWIAAWNLFVVNAYYDDIPDTAFGIATHKASLPLLVLNLCLIALALLGVWITRRADT